ncbi:MAG: hypothetical protein ABMB14_21570 [Myxococcota bacterium]
MSFQHTHGVVIDAPDALLSIGSARAVLDDLRAVATRAGLEVFGLWRIGRELPPALDPGDAACVGVGRSVESAPELLVRGLDAVAADLGARWPVRIVHQRTGPPPAPPAAAWRARQLEAILWEATRTQRTLAPFARGRAAADAGPAAVARWVARDPPFDRLVDALGWHRRLPDRDPEVDRRLVEAVHRAGVRLAVGRSADARIGINAVCGSATRRPPVRVGLEPSGEAGEPGIPDWLPNLRWALAHPAEACPFAALPFGRLFRESMGARPLG